MLWPYILYFDLLILFYYLNIFKRKWINVCDRYAYSYYVTWRHYGYSNKFIDWLYLHFPRPDYCIVLEADPLTLYKRLHNQKVVRETDYSLVFFSSHYKKYNQLRKYYGFPYFNTCSGTVIVTNQIIDLINK